MDITATFAIGRNRGRPRIWLDGKRLLDIGFTPGSYYTCFVGPEKIIGIIGDLTGSPSTWPKGVITAHMRKVSGRLDGKPIIDLSGRDVAHAFPGITRIQARFRERRIDITPIKP